jgi:2-keto-4-pentenoate hydratase/2-oxohepta-3-ene-1,7-dioic acid hydratase in catechol pathway
MNGTRAARGLRFYTVEIDGVPRVGIGSDAFEGVADIQVLADRAGFTSDQRLALASVLGIASNWDRVAALMPLLVNEAARTELRFGAPTSTFRAPLSNPPTIYGVGVNYAEHSPEFQGKDAPLPDAPIIFVKATGVSGPGDPISLHPNVTSEVDYEAELGVVIGRGGSNLAPDEVKDHIFGFTCLNDVTARDLQRRHRQWMLGKSLASFCPTGPCILHRDAVPWPPTLDIACEVNGELRQSSNTRNMIFDIPTLVSCISAGRTLQPGDLIATGTPRGVAMGMDPPRFLKSGDTVTITIESIGALSNICV